jgi:hypothetical protein
MEEVIDASVAHGIEELLAERALVTDSLARAEVGQLRALMDEARTRRLQPHYIEGAFASAATVDDRWPILNHWRVAAGPAARGAAAAD